MSVTTPTRACTIGFALSVTCRSMSPMPTLRVNFIECWETAKGKVQHFSWVTDLRVNKGTVYRLMQGARARWRIENETFNTLKNQGYHFEHNFGHGYQHLSVVFAVLMMLAFLVDQVQQLCCPLFQAAWAKWGSKRLLWEKMRALFYDYALESMRAPVRSAVLWPEEIRSRSLTSIPLNRLPPHRPSRCADPNRRASTTWAELYQNGGQPLHRSELDSLSRARGASKSTDGFVQWTRETRSDIARIGRANRERELLKSNLSDPP